MSKKLTAPIEVPRPEEETEEQKRAREEKERPSLKERPAKDETTEGDMTAEDKLLKETIDFLVQRICEKADTAEETGLQKNALEALRKEIKGATASMTSVPRPLKFLRPHYPKMKTHFETISNENKSLFADILSVMAMTMAEESSLESLKYKLLGAGEPVGTWGHEYVRNLAGEISQEYQKRQEESKPVDDLLKLVEEIVPFNIEHSAEIEAVDLLMEVEQLPQLLKFITAHNYNRVCNYVLRLADYLPDREEQIPIQDIAYQGFLKNDRFAEALSVAFKMESDEKVKEVLAKAEGDKAMIRQLGYMIGQIRYRPADAEEGLGLEVKDEGFQEAAGNVEMGARYLELAKDLGVVDPKTPEDIYKTHLTEGTGGIASLSRPVAREGPAVDSAKQNLASTFVNAFVNAGHGKDLLLTPEGSDWVFKNKDAGMLCAAASLGVITLWDLDNGFSAVDKFSHLAQPYARAGAVLGQGLLSSGVTSEMDAAYALCAEHLDSDDVKMRVSAIMGLGYTYAGQCRAEVKESLVPILVDSSNGIELVAHSALSLGLVFTGTADEDLSASMLEVLMERGDAALKDPIARLLVVGLALLFLGRGEQASGTLSVAQALEHPIKTMLEQTIEVFAWAGTGNVLQIQKLLGVVAEHYEEDEKDPFKTGFQDIAVLGLAAVASGEDLSSKMILRTFDHILQYGEVNVRRAIPLAYSLASICHPQLQVVDILSKLSHDSDQIVSQNACLALGFVGAGTNNSRIANTLRQLAAYYEKEPNHLFLVRIAQGLLHMGKGLLTLNPFVSERFVMHKVSMASLLSVLHICLDNTNLILKSKPHLLFGLVPALRVRCLITVDEDGKPVPVTVRLGQALDVVGQAGKPRSITGFVTHTTPVIISANERVEFASDKYIPMTSMLEGFVVVKKNPDYKEPELK